MSMQRKVVLGCLVWVILITTLHLFVNLAAFDARMRGEDPFRVGFLPVT